MDKVPLTVVILAKNEERRIEDCLKSVIDWAQEIIVVDDESCDSTVEISRRLGAKVLIKNMDIEGQHRNWAYAQGSNSWILSLDADERVTPELRDELKEIINSNPIPNAFTIPRRNFIGDYWIRWGGQYPAAQIKLFRPDKFKWEEAEVHRFVGSPSIRVNGEDLFPSDQDQLALGCRVYQTPEGFRGWPTEAMLREKLAPYMLSDM